MTVYVHFVRHGEVASHRGDVPITEQGKAAAQRQGRKLAGSITGPEHVEFLHAVTKRTKQTCELLRKGFMEAVREDVTVFHPEIENAIRNPDIYLGGKRVELVSSVEALAAQVPNLGFLHHELLELPFWTNFLNSPDRIGYWLHLENPPGENAEAVARRLMAYAESLSLIPGNITRRYICVSHSPVLRAFLNKYLLEKDLGEPEYCESINLTFSRGTCKIQYRSFEKENQLIGGTKDDRISSEISL
ncbi:phosphoglycerate mutase family protein [Peribacillus sp. SCS-155]|uniref:phosphoglycerate mutase family protein n=1 Tax=Peribacillus sedimenti TaxID=3115297 RepID=UPI00390690F9